MNMKKNSLFLNKGKKKKIDYSCLLNYIIKKTTTTTKRQNC